MTDHQNAAGILSHLHKRFGVRNAKRYRFFHEDVFTCQQRLTCQGSVTLSGGRDSNTRYGWVGQNLNKSADRDCMSLGEARSSTLVDIADRGEHP